MIRSVATLLLSLLAAGASAADIARHTLPAQLKYPEGIALEKDGSAFYTASAENGAVVRVDLASGESKIVVPPGVLMNEDSPFPGLLGLELEARMRPGARQARDDARDLDVLAFEPRRQPVRHAPVRARRGPEKSDGQRERDDEAPFP